MRSDRPRVPILMYHKVGLAPPGSLVPAHYVAETRLRAQCRMLKALGFASVPLDRLWEPPMPPRPIVFTFDDGYQNFADRAVPILREAGYDATVFVVAGLVGGTNAWDVAKGDVPEPLMDAAALHRVRDAGMGIGSHTSSHADLSTADETTAWREVAGSKESLEGLIGAPVTTFCYPYGRLGPGTQELVRRAGYRFACTVQGGTNDQATDPMLLRRVNVRRDTSAAVLVLKLIRDYRRA